MESSADRRRKRIVEHTIDGFINAQTAIIFGNTVERLVNEKIGVQKFRQYIGSKDTSLAITDTWVGEVVLKTTFLEINGEDSTFILNQVSKTLKTHNDLHRANIRIVKALTRDKPQPQFISPQYIPRTSVVNNIG
jgi:hypothetical protein